MPGLQQRFTPQAVEFLQQMVVAALQSEQRTDRLPASLLQPFSAVNIVDSSLFTLPEALRTHFPGSLASPAHPAQLKLYLSYDYLTGQVKAVEWTNGRNPDQPIACRQPTSRLTA